MENYGYANEEIERKRAESKKIIKKEQKIHNRKQFPAFPQDKFVFGG
jgi:hypothetical protein